MKIYTLSGDDGTTSLAGGKRVPKHSPRVDAYGSVDELISWIGLLRGLKENECRKGVLIYVQDQLMRCAAVLATDNDGSCEFRIFPEQKSLEIIEREIDRMEETLPKLNHFILPGGNLAVSYCHIARCVCRRAERSVSFLSKTEKTPEITGKILNRLSDFLFVMARKLSSELENEEIKWPC